VADHKLAEGKKVIWVLAKLGEALGYEVRPEMPVEQRTQAPAVDLAWFAEGEQRYPLMIFEVESAATNSMANNPTKVFGQPAEEFERPLFFFHVVISSGLETTRIERLRGVFGLHNYRVYPLDKNTSTRLICDVLNQHRRIRNRICVGPMIGALLAAPEMDVDKRQVLEHAAEAGLKGSYLRDLALWARNEEAVRALFLVQLKDFVWLDKWPSIDSGYDSNLGSCWGFPLHIALLSFGKVVEQPALFEKLQWWQEKSSYMSQIGPHFGLSRDYDAFVLGTAGAFCALIAVLMMNDEEAVRYVAQQMQKVLFGIKSCVSTVWIYTAFWSLHLAAAANDGEGFEGCRSFANARGGLPKGPLYSPPAVWDVEGLQEHQCSYSEPVPSMDEFKAEVSQRCRGRVVPDVFELGLRALTQVDGNPFDASALVAHLATGRSANIT
jgi:hypothetical protein